MQGKIVAIPKWILLLAFTQVSGFMVQQFSDLNEKLLTNIVNAVKGNDFHNVEDFKNVVHDTVKKHLANKNLSSRKGEDVKDFINKRLVKRIVPHGYEVNDVEYDHKFKTLFKPLVRIHKRKPDTDDLSDEGDLYDLIYILDDKSFEDSPLAKDDSLLKPFTVDNMDVKYLPTDNEVESIEYIINKGGNVIDVNSPSFNQFSDFEQSRYKMGDSTETKAKKFSNSIYLDDDKLKQVLGQQMEHWIPYDQEPATSPNIYELLNKNAKFTINKNKRLRIPTTNPEKPHRFISIDKLLSKPFKPEQNNNGLKESIARSYTLQSLPHKYTNDKNYINFLNLLQKQVQTKEIKKDIQPLGWFGPVGVLNSKQLKKTDGYDDIDSPKTYNYEEMRHNQPKNNNNLLGSLKQIKTSGEDQYIGSDSMQDNVRGLFGPIGRIHSKHLKYDDWKRETDTRGDQFNFIKPKDFRQNNDIDIGKEIQSNKFTLLNEIAQLKANNFKNQITERLKDKELSIAEKLRSHIKSGEEEEAAQRDKQLFDYVDGPTTEKHMTRRPKYPYWNEWTYDKQIVQDDCKGKLVQSGQVCIHAFA